MIEHMFPETVEIVCGGCPWHGRVAGGVLTLPNAQTMAAPQPGGTALATWYAGAVWVQQHPAAGSSLQTLSFGATRDAADAAAGRRWLNYALLSGESQLFYGKPLNGWLWADANGESWWVQTDLGAVQRGVAVNITVTLRRFGVFDGNAAQYDYPVTLADNGLTAAYGYLNQQAFAYLDDVRPDGGAAVFGLGVVPYDNGSTFSNDRLADVAYCPIGALPLAFLELTLHGAGASANVALNVARTMGQTVNVTTPAGVATDTFDLWLKWSDTEHGNCAILTNTFNVDRLYEFSWIPRGNSTAGWRQKVSEVTLPAGGSASTSITENHILSLFYRADGSLAEVTLVVIQQRSLVSSPASPSPVSNVTHQLVYGCSESASPGYSPEQATRISLATSGSATADLTMTLIRDGVTIASESITATHGIDSTHEFDIGGGTYNAGTQDDTRGLVSSLGHSFSASASFTNTQQALVSSSFVSDFGYYWASSPMFSSTPAGMFNADTGVYLEPVRWSNRMWGLRATSHPTVPAATPQPGDVLTWTYTAATGRFGTAAGFSIQNPAGEKEYRYGTEDPITSAAEIGSRTPVGYL